MTKIESRDSEQSSHGDIPPGSLLEHLYTHYGLNQLKSMLEEQVGVEVLAKWRVEPEEFRATLKLAIQHVERE